MIGLWITAFCLLGSTAGKEVCYERIGCFSDKPPWSGIPGRFLPGLPDPPEGMNITFSLYTKETRNRFQILSAIYPSTIDNSHFSSHRRTRFIVHGFKSNAKNTWVIHMCMRLIQVEDVNCIAVDWEEGAKDTYVRAVNNIRVIGAEIAYFINTLKKTRRYSPSQVHIIGHSLGAHAAAEAGRRIKGIKRITGLDPAGMFFEGAPPEVRLDPSDALFVDVIHSNAALSPVIGFGMYKATGDLDFYPNGGHLMPGCDQLVNWEDADSESFVDETFNVNWCHHSRSHEFYLESILHPDGFLGYPCVTYESFQSGACFPCPRKGCPMMGHYADRFPYKQKKRNQKYFLNTGAFPPFISWRQKVSLTLSGTRSVMGEINMVFQDTKGNTHQYQIGRGFLCQYYIYTKYIDFQMNPREITKVEFLWKTTPFTPPWAELGAVTASIVNGKDGHTSTFCGKETVTYEVPQLLKPCKKSLDVTAV